MSALWTPLAGLAVAALARSWRWEVRGQAHVDAERSQGTGVIFAPWHATMIPLV